MDNFMKHQWVNGFRVQQAHFGLPDRLAKISRCKIRGCFFFEVELREGCILPQLGLAGDQFVPKVGVKSVTGIGGIGDDEYSCGVDGLHRACLKNGPISSWNVSWPSGDSADFVQIDFDCHNREREEKEILGKTVVVGALTPVKWFLSEVLERKYPKVMHKKHGFPLYACYCTLLVNSPKTSTCLHSAM